MAAPGSEANCDMVQATAMRSDSGVVRLPETTLHIPLPRPWGDDATPSPKDLEKTSSDHLRGMITACKQATLLPESLMLHAPNSDAPGKRKYLGKDDMVQHLTCALRDYGKRKRDFHAREPAASDQPSASSQPAASSQPSASSQTAAPSQSPACGLEELQETLDGHYAALASSLGPALAHACLAQTHLVTSAVWQHGVLCGDGSWDLVLLCLGAKLVLGQTGTSDVLHAVGLPADPYALRIERSIMILVNVCPTLGYGNPMLLAEG